jgi:hypothetical protein
MSNCNKSNVRPLSLIELKSSMKKIKNGIIKNNPEKFGHASDKQIMEAMGVHLHDVNYYIDVKGGKKSKSRKMLRKTVRKTLNKRNKKRNSRRKTTKTR